MVVLSENFTYYTVYVHMSAVSLNINMDLEALKIKYEKLSFLSSLKSCRPVDQDI